MSENDYLLAWYIYLGAAALGYLAGWQLTSGLWRWLREPLRVVATVLLFTPSLIDPARDLYAPAIAVAALDVLFKANNHLSVALLDVASIGAMAAGVYAVFVLGRWLFWRSRPVPVAEKTAAPETAENSR